MPTFVLLHGAWHGAWCWGRVMPLLAAAGHHVTAPTFTGLGERRHLASRAVDLDTHVDDVINHLLYEDLTDVALVAHSYAGFVAAGVIARAADRIGRLVLVDGFVPRTGDAMADHIGERGPAYRAEADRDPDWMIPPPSVSVFGVTDPADVAWTEPRLTPQPVYSYLQPIGSVDLDAVADRAYVACTTPALSVLEESKRRVREGAWRVAEVAAGHDALITRPREIADAISASA